MVYRRSRLFFLFVFSTLFSLSFNYFIVIAVVIASFYTLKNLRAKFKKKRLKEDDGQ